MYFDHQTIEDEFIPIDTFRVKPKGHIMISAFTHSHADSVSNSHGSSPLDITALTNTNFLGYQYFKYS